MNTKEIDFYNITKYFSENDNIFPLIKKKEKNYNIIISPIDINSYEINNPIIQTFGENIYFMIFDDLNNIIFYQNQLSVLNEKKINLDNFDQKFYITPMYDGLIIHFLWLDDELYFICKNEFMKYTESDIHENYQYLEEQLTNQELVYCCLISGEKYSIKENREFHIYFYTAYKKGERVEFPNGLDYLPRRFFSCLDELVVNMEHKEYENKTMKNIEVAGYIIDFHESEKLNQTFIYYTSLYSELLKLLRKYKNRNTLYLNLYQKDELPTYLPFMSKYYPDIIARVNLSMCTITREILNIYHSTRNRKNPELFNSLTDSYKKVLNKLHNIFLENCEKKTLWNCNISLGNVYTILKQLSTSELRIIFLDRKTVMKNYEHSDNFFIKNCHNTSIQRQLLAIGF